MQLADFHYDLPGELIARHPPPERRASRLLALDPANDDLADRRFAELPQLLAPDDLLVFNDTRVIPARLHGHKDSGGKVELLLERQLADTTALVQLRASKPPKPGSILNFADGCEAEVIARQGAFFELRFDRPVEPFLEQHGEMPLPPYIERLPETSDRDRYQTVYAREPGAVAAPTAGLHFDEEMLQETRAAGIGHAYVTLHVGAGTFQNLREEQVEANRLHSERVQVDVKVCEQIRATQAAGGRVIAIGTTTVRSLEIAAAGGAIEPYDGETDLFIRPGYRFNVVDAMLTNFHLPQSSLLMLVSAFAGRERILRAYAHAVAERYRFFSYGDAMFIQSRDSDS